MEKVEILMDALGQAMGDYALQKRRLLADYKDRQNRDRNQSLTVWHSRNASDAALVESVRRKLTQSGYTLAALWELRSDGSTKALYLAPGCLEACAAEMGFPMPQDMAASLTAAGIHPVNWEELIRTKR